MTTSAKFHRCWTQEGINRYFTTEAMAKDKEAFMEVHLPISQIIVDKGYNAFYELNGQEYTNEEGLKNLILKSTPTQPNRIFSLVGETGSGKSELCQWLYYQIQDQVHMPILIRRSMIRLREIVVEINRLLNEPVSEEVKEITDLWEEAVSKQLVASMLLYLSRPEVLNQFSGQDAYDLRQLIDTRNFEMRMRQNFVDYRDEMGRLNKPRDPNLLPEPHFRDLVVANGGLKDPSGCYRHLQRAISDCLVTTLQIDDLIGKLRRISAAFKVAGQRPVLLIEDITTFGFLQNDLLDSLFDLGSGNYDVVIGITTGFEKANEQQIYKAQQTIRERVEGRFVLTDDHSETLFLRQNYTKLAALYLNAVKDDQCSLCCNDLTLNQAFGQDLYPFNQQFLYNVYSSLQQDGNRKQTPRLYLRALSHTLQVATTPPFESIEILPIIRPPTVWFAQSVVYSNALEKLLQWYGYNTNIGVFLAKQIAEAFQVAVPANIELVNSYYKFPLRPGVTQSLPQPLAIFVSAEPPLIPSEVTTVVALPIPTGQKEEPSVVAPPPPRSPPITQSMPSQIDADLFAQLDQWLNRQGKFPDRERFKDGVWKLLDLFQLDPFTLQHPYSIARNGNPLVYSRGDKNSQLYLHDSADSLPVGYLKLTIHPRKELRDLYSQVLALGLGNYRIDDAIHLDHPLLYDWLDGCVNNLRQQMEAGLSSALNMSLEQFIILTKYLLLNNTTGLSEFTPEALAQPIGGKPFSLGSMGDRPAQLFEWQNDIQSLFIANFHLRDSIINYPYLAEVMANCNPLQMLSNLRAIDSSNVYDAYKIGSAKDTDPLRGLVKVVSLYTRDLVTIQQGRQLKISPTFEELQTIADLCVSADEIYPEKMRTQLDKLRQLCSRIGINWQRQWDLSLEPLDKAGSKLDFQTFGERLAQLLSRLTQLDAQINIFVYLSLQREVQAITASLEYEILETVRKVDQSIDYFLVTRAQNEEVVKGEARYEAFQKTMNLYLEVAKK